MIRFFFTSVFFISSAVYCQSVQVHASEKTRKFIKEVSKIIKENSIYTDSLNWKEIGTEANLLPLSDTDSINQVVLIQFFTDKLRQAGDKHSFFLTKKTTSDLRQNRKMQQSKGVYLGEGVGLIKVPPYMTFEPTEDVEFANTIRAEIKKMDAAYNIVGWMVDLRQNTGGNMWPMLAGLNALIDDGTIGYFVSPTSKRKVSWVSQNGQISFSKRKVDDYKIKNTKTKIAVLIDTLTASSGEMTAISLIGLPNVRVFGMPSAGYTTANATFRLSDGTQLFLAASYVADRTEKPYLDKIIPDVVIDNNPNTTLDKTVESARKWLLQ